jgi:hypothetical protein
VVRHAQDLGHRLDAALLRPQVGEAIPDQWCGIRSRQDWDMDAARDIGEVPAEAPSGALPQDVTLATHRPHQLPAQSHKDRQVR